MKSLGIEFDANRMNYVVVTRNASDENTVVTSGKLSLEDSRDAEAVRFFSSAVREMVNIIGPEIISIKAKPENGQMRAGATALKMEALVLAHSLSPVYFLSSQRVEKAAANNGDLYAYQQGAWKAAVAGFDGPPKKPAAKKPKPKAK